jgi:FAD:protein FMN transferase
MGVPFRIVLYAASGGEARLAANSAFERIRSLNDKLSDYSLESELSQLSRGSGKGRAVKVSDDLWRVLKAAQDVSQPSEGAFDITVGPAVNLWRHARRLQELPRADRLAEARSRIGYTNIVLNAKSKTVLLRVPEMRLDLGGIAKGYAADEALKVLRQNGIRRALVAAAGDVALGHAPPGEKGWKIELTTLEDTNAPPPRFMFLQNVGVATSGDMFQRLEIDGVRYSHIIDPRTGIGLTNRILVSVIAPDCMTADALATAVSVLGAEKGLQLIDRTKGTAARILRPRDGRIEVIERPVGTPLRGVRLCR